MEGWFQLIKPCHEGAHVAAVIYQSHFLCSSHLQGYLECTHILASRQKFPVPGSICGVAIYFSCTFLAKADYCGFCSTITTRESCRQGRGQSQDNRKLIYIHRCDKRIALTSGRTSQFIILPFISGGVSSRALVHLLIAPEEQLLCPAAGALLP